VSPISGLSEPHLDSKITEEKTRTLPESVSGKMSVGDTESNTVSAKHDTVAATTSFGLGQNTALDLGVGFGLDSGMLSSQPKPVAPSHTEESPGGSTVNGIANSTGGGSMMGMGMAASMMEMLSGAFSMGTKGGT